MTDTAAVAGVRLEDAFSAITDTHVSIGDVTNPEDLARLLAEARELKWQLGVLYDDLERQLASTLEAKGLRVLDVEGLGRIERKRKLRRTGWDHDALIPLLVKKSRSERRFDGDSGEVEGEAEAAVRVLRECVSFGAAKIRALSSRGIEADSYCTVSDDGYGIQLPPSDHGGRS